LSGTEPATVFRLVAEEALKLTGADAAMVAIPVDEGMPEADVAELVVIETVGGAVGSIAGRTIPVAGTSLGNVFANGTPRSVDRIELDGVDAGPALTLPLRPAIPSPAWLSYCAKAVRAPSSTNNSR
jgi:two-component system, NarL family, sensor histidine kinase DevS